MSFTLHRAGKAILLGLCVSYKEYEVLRMRPLGLKIFTTLHFLRNLQLGFYITLSWIGLPGTNTLAYLGLFVN